MELVSQIVMLLFSILFMLFALYIFISSLTNFVINNRKINAKNTDSCEYDSDSNL